MAVTKPPVVDVFANTIAPGPSDLFDIPSYMDSGFPAPSGVPVRPPLGFFNWLFWFCMLGVRYLCSFGIATWDSGETEYTAGSLILDGSDNRYYKCVGTATTGTAPHLDLTNWQPWLASPFASAGATATEIWAWYNAKKLRRFAIDQRGYPAGRYDQWSENFIDVNATSHNAQSFSGGWFGRWKISGNMPVPASPFGQLAVIPASAGVGSVSTELPTAAQLISAEGAAGAVVVEMCNPLQQVGHNSDLVMELLCWFVGAGIGTTCSFAVGLFDGTVAAGVPIIPFETFAPKGIGLYRPSGGTNWLVYSNVSGTPAAPIDTGIGAAVTFIYRMRFEITGSANSSDGADHCVIYLNGTKVADLNILPHIAATPAFYVYGDSSGGGPVTMNIGAVRGTINTSIADIVY